MKQVLKLSVTLFLITAFVAAALAGVNAFTKAPIAAAREEKTNRAILALFPQGTEVRQLTETEYTDASGMVNTVFSTSDGWAVEVHPAGFGGEITLMVGITQDQKVSGIQVISHAETPGLGAIAAAKNAAGTAFRDSFVGADGQAALGVGDIDALSGATITSQAIVDGVNAALSCQIQEAPQ